MEAKQHASAQPTNHRRNIKRNQNIIEMNENENMTTQSLWNPVKVVLRGTFIAIQAYLKKQEKNQTNNLVLHLKQLEKDSSRKKKKENNNKKDVPNRNVCIFLYRKVNNYIRICLSLFPLQ